MLRDYPVHSTLPASDLARARRFYEEVLAFVPERVSPAGVTYRAKGSLFLLFPSASAGTNKATACGFQVPDLPAAVAELKGRGVKFEEYDFGQFKTVDGIVRTPVGSSAWFLDTEGNTIGLVQLDDPIS
jgi:predicted enzyme related to lactoylglutathione lyase